MIVTEREKYQILCAYVRQGWWLRGRTRSILYTIYYFFLYSISFFFSPCVILRFGCCSSDSGRCCSLVGKNGRTKGEKTCGLNQDAKRFTTCFLNKIRVFVVKWRGARPAVVARSGPTWIAMKLWTRKSFKYRLVNTVLVSLSSLIPLQSYSLYNSSVRGRKDEIY